MMTDGELPLLIGGSQEEIKRFESAIIGQSDADLRVVYSAEKIIDILSEDMTREEAEEFYEFNILGAYMGEMTPIYVSEHDSIYDFTLPD
tara:strand:- start:2255 stop:2524 length:270 start_codon:yes stop_codon:yes gene_type:complete